MASRFSAIRYQMQDQLLEYLDRSGLRPGDSLPSERSLCRELGLNRSTLRAAMQELAEEGYLSRLPQREYRLPPTKIRMGLCSVNSLSETVAAQGMSFSRRLLSAKRVEANKTLASKLDVFLGAPLAHIRRLAHVNGTPSFLEDAYLNEAFCPHILRYHLAKDSLFRILKEEYGILIGRVESQLIIRAANREEALLFETEPGAPLMVEDSVSYSREGHPVEHLLLCSSSHVEYEGGTYLEEVEHG